MRKEKAKNHFLGKNECVRLNCGQSVIKAYYDKFEALPDEVALFAAFGAGRAPQGECGAYYAARHLLSKKHTHKIGQSAQDFINFAGSMKCKDIRKLRKVTCLECVEKAVDLLEGENDD